MKEKLGWTIATILILVAGGGLNGWLWFSLLPEKLDELDQEEKKRAVAQAQLKGPALDLTSDCCWSCVVCVAQRCYRPRPRGHRVP